MDECKHLRFARKSFAKTVFASVEEDMSFKKTSNVGINDVFDCFGRDASQLDGSVVEWRGLVAFFLKTGTTFPVCQSFGRMPFVIEKKSLIGYN